jgi:glycosyltransferase involved in cell wall biosynthesis
VNVLIWHVHGSWTTAFVRGSHTYLVPVLPDRGPDGRGRPDRPGTFDWPASAVEVSPGELRDAAVDVVVLQRPHERDLAAEWLGGRVPGVDVPAVYLEHNAPQGMVNEMRHPAADWPGVTVVHVTHFNDLFWDCGTSPTRVVEHGVVDPGYRYTGEIAAGCVVVNEPVRRRRVTGTDLLDRFRAAVPVDLFGMRSEPLGGDDLPQSELHPAMARRRVYLHPVRWTSLGLSLLEAMHLGMPVVALATTEVVEAVPPGAGVVSTDVDRLVRAARDLVGDPELARAMGKAAREAALARYGLARFLDDWERVLAEVTAG